MSAAQNRLKNGQIAVVIAIGVVFWYLGVTTSQFGTAAGLFGGTASAIQFALTFPGLWAVVLLTKRLAGLTPEQILPGMMTALAAATFCDGTALTWYPELYGATAEQVVLGAGWVLFGAGATIAMAMFEARRSA